MKKALYMGVVLLICAGLSFGFEETRNLNLDAGGIEQFDVSCGAGFLKIVGIQGLRNIEVEAKITVKGVRDSRTEEYLEKNLVLTLEKRGRRAILKSSFKSRITLFSFTDRRIDLTINIPKNLDCEIDDGSGSISIMDVDGNLVIDDGSGEIILEGIKGDVKIDDGSGDLRIENIQGDVWIDDGSGGIKARYIQGRIEVDDGSGSIFIKSAEGDVSISDGSGSIRIDDIEKDVIIKRDGSGSVDISNVRGKVIK